MKKLSFIFSDPTKQAALLSLVDCVENIEALTVRIDNTRNQLPRGTNTFFGEAARLYSDLFEMEIRRRCYAATGFTLFALIAEPVDRGPFGISYENDQLVEAFEEAGFSGVDSLEQWAVGPLAYKPNFKSVGF